MKALYSSPSECGIADLVRDLQVEVVPEADGGARPLAHAVGGEDRGVLQWRREKRAGGMREVVLGEEDLASKFSASRICPFTQSFWVSILHGVREASRSWMRHRAASQDALELEHRLLVEDDVVELVGVQVRGFEAVVRRAQGQTRVVFEAAEALLFGGGHQLAVAQ